MAQNDSQIEIMKKYYTKISHNVTTYRSFCHEPNSVIITKLKNSPNSSKEKEKERGFSQKLAGKIKIPSNSTSRVQRVLFRFRIDCRIQEIIRNTDTSRGSLVLSKLLYKNQHTRQLTEGLIIRLYCRQRESTHHCLSDLRVEIGIQIRVIEKSSNLYSPHQLIIKIQTVLRINLEI